MTTHRDSGPEFERRAIDVARAIHDPFGLQGPVMFDGREHDGIFISDDAIHAFEVTQLRTKDKAKKDAEKICKILIYLSRLPEHRYKSLTGWFVTSHEPLADQRMAVEAEARKNSLRINPVSLLTLQKRMCDSTGYLRHRDSAPFGSTSYGSRGQKPTAAIDPRFRVSGDTLSIGDVSDALSSGTRILLTGEFGVGKSFATRELYKTLRKRHLRDSTKPFPVHINLRDCAGLRTPAEILRRHAEEIGFGSDKGLLSAWRLGSCILLLDGFDEVIPRRWLGNASDLRQVRYDALSAIRRMIVEAPDNAGILICGRAHFFSSTNEMLETLEFDRHARLMRIEDFEQDQVTEYLEKSGVSANIPEWMPNRPLLLGYLLAQGFMADDDLAAGHDEAEAWRRLFDAICQREAHMFSAVRSQMIANLVSRIATFARANNNELGPIDMMQMEKAFYEVNGYQPDEEGRQLLLRLPGLANLSAADSQDSSELRVFADRSLAATAYGLDLIRYLSAPYERHPLSASSSWVNAAADLSVDVAAHAALEQGFTRRVVLSVADRRQDENKNDAVLADCIRVADALPGEVPQVGYQIEGVLFEYISPGDTTEILNRSTLRDCVIDTLDLNMVVSTGEVPSFNSCIVGFVDGMASMPDWLTAKFTDTVIEDYSQLSRTTSGITQLPYSDEKIIALTILKKVYSQAGTARKESALTRGLSQRLRTLVPAVTSKLVAEGWLQKGGVRGTTVYRAVKGVRGRAFQVLDNPGSFVFG